MMHTLREWIHRVWGTLRGRSDTDLAEELRLHRELAEEAARRSAGDITATGRAARIAVRGTAQAMEAMRDQRGLPWLHDLTRDVRYGVRMLRRNPVGFTAVAVLTLALGIGANVAIFSLLNAALLRSLPVVQNPQELMFFGTATASGSTGFIPNGNTQIFSYQFFRDFRRDNRVFSNVAAIGSILFRPYGGIAGGANLEKVSVELVSGSYFEMLGVPAIAGRVLADSDDRTPGGHPVAVASYAWVQQRFASAQSVVGSAVSIGSRSYVVIGVAPPGFSGVTVGQSPDLWIPLAMQREVSPGWNGLEDPMFRSLHLIARVKPGVPLAQAQAATNLRFREILRDYVGADASENRLGNIQRAYVELTPATAGRSQLRSQFTAPLLILMAIVCVVLMIACANVANLLLARATVREREIAVRMALGASRFRLMRQLLVESLLLGLIGAVLGLTLASWAGRLLIALVSTASEPLALAAEPDATVLAFTAAVAIATVILFGVIPAFHATRLNLSPSLKDGRTVGVAPARSRLSRALVVSEIALSLALIAGAMLFLRSFANLMDLDTGFDRRNVLVAGVEPGSAGYKVDERLESMMTRVEERLAAIPGVRGASFAYFVFDGGGWSTDDIAIPGRQRAEMDSAVDLNLVGPAYLDIMRMPILAGRGLSSRDTAASRRVAVINETMARMYFGERLPLGRTFTVRDDEKSENDFENIEVVGVVKDAKYMTLQEEQMPAAFFPHAQHRRNFLFTLVVRHAGDAATIAPALRRAVAEIDPDLPVDDIMTLERRVEDSVVSRRAIARLSSAFGFVAIILACVGIYGVTSYGIVRRTNEFGVRLAIGASRRQVLQLVLSETARTGVQGVAFGLLVALAFGRIVSGSLYGIAPYDPLTISVSMVTMIAVSLVAGYIPAWKATRIDPIAALRQD